MATEKGQKIGALWIREQRGGGDYMTGELEIDGVRQRIVVFRNGYRTETNRQPHYNIYRDTQQAPTSERAAESSPMSDGPARWS